MWSGKHGRLARFWDVGKAIVGNWEWDQVDEVELLHDCAIPLVVELFWTLFFPVATLGVCVLLAPQLSGLIRTILVRSVVVLTCSVQLGRVRKDQLRRFLDAAHKAARDDRYLIGEVLMNYGEPETAVQ